MNLKRTPKRIALLIASTVALTAGAVGGAFAMTGDDDAQERPIPAADLDQAKQAALEETGGGTVTGTEVGRGDGAFLCVVVAGHGEGAADGAGGQRDGAGDQQGDPLGCALQVHGSTVGADDDDSMSLSSSAHRRP